MRHQIGKWQHAFFSSSSCFSSFVVSNNYNEYLPLFSTVWITFVVVVVVFSFCFNPLVRAYNAIRVTFGFVLFYLRCIFLGLIRGPVI